MRQRLVVVVVLAAVAAPVVVAAAQTSGPAGPTPQEFFRTALLKDTKTASSVKALLKSKAGFVDPAVQFVDVTGDNTTDAIVAVTDGGAAGGRAIYVFSQDGAKKLRVVYRNQL